MLFDFKRAQVTDWQQAIPDALPGRQVCAQESQGGNPLPHGCGYAEKSAGAINDGEEDKSRQYSTNAPLVEGFQSCPFRKQDVTHQPT